MVGGTWEEGFSHLITHSPWLEQSCCLLVAGTIHSTASSFLPIIMGPTGFMGDPATPDPILSSLGL